MGCSSKLPVYNRLLDLILNADGSFCADLVIRSDSSDCDVIIAMASLT